MTPSKITIIGVGSVGSTLAYELGNIDSPLHIGLFDIKEGFLDAQLLDISQATPSRDTLHTYARFDSYNEIKNQDVIVITCGLGQKPGQSRLELIHDNYELVKSVYLALIEDNSDASYIILTNPVDVILNKLYSDPELSEFDDTFNSVFSTGTLLDTHRLFHALEIHPQSDDYSTLPMVLGEHGDSQIIYDESDMIRDTTVGELVRTSAGRIIKGKGCTNFAIATTTTYMIEILISKTKAVLPLSTYQSYLSDNFSTAVSVPILLENGEIKGILQDFDTKQISQRIGDSISIISQTSKDSQ